MYVFFPLSLPLQENERSKDVIIDHRFHKQIIGTKGEKIREIRDRFNGVQVRWGGHVIYNYANYVGREMFSMALKYFSMLVRKFCVVIKID